MDGQRTHAQQRPASLDGFKRIIGTSACLEDVRKKARVLARVDSPVLLQGETGVGKDVFARALHESGPRPNGAFVALNCAGRPHDLLAIELIDKIAAADGGSLFLDEIAELPVDLQPYLLRVLEDDEVHFKLIAACNTDLRLEVQAKRFRPDLFYRISMTTLQIPTLRERKGDLPMLVQHFSAAASERHRVAAKHFAPEVLDVFERCSWPGNLRQLRNVVELMVLLADGECVDLSVLPSEVLDSEPPAGNPPVAAINALGGLSNVEREAIQAVIRVHRGNLTLVARELQISRSTIYLKLRKYGLEALLNEVRGRC
ncbi:MAG TPA: sigma 54-interacting transcriptional regulator [Polyangiales bacterium]|nr:sigma 54-interacting transcriptional regulator [Polyangiales bacterium]